MINKVVLIGHIGKDVEMRTFEDGGKVANTSLATQENYKDKNGKWQTVTEWHKLSGRNKIADAMDARMKKGALMYVEGKLKTRSWGDEGNKKYVTEVVVSYARVINKNEQSSESGTLDEPQRLPHPTQQQPATAGATTTPSDTTTDSTDDLPF